MWLTRPPWTEKLCRVCRIATLQHRSSMPRNGIGISLYARNGEEVRINALYKPLPFSLA